MSNYIQISATISISSQLEWIDNFIDCIYMIGPLHIYTFDQPIPCDADGFLSKPDAKICFKRYIQEMRAHTHTLDDFPSISWLVESISYEVPITIGQNYLRWTMYLLSNKKYKDQECYYTDFEYYILLLIEIMKKSHILEIATDEECRWDDLNWTQKEGKWWGFKVHIPQEKENFQMLDAIIFPSLNNTLLQELVEKAAMQGYRLSPVGLGGYTTKEVIAHLSDQKSCLSQWKYVCDETIYDVTMSAMTGGFATRLFFRTVKSKNPPAVDQLARHALTLINDYTILQFVSFDSRYNYLISR